jgi:hypothetical protein
MRSVLIGLGIALLVGCGDDAAPRTVSIGDGGPDPEDAGPPDGGPEPPRPDGGSILPPADEELELAYGGPAIRYQLSAEASLGALDLHLSVDTTGSMDSEIDELQQNLADTILPAIRRVVPQLSVGVSRFEDFPRPPFGDPRSTAHRADLPFQLLTPITSDESDILEAVAKLDAPLGTGGDTPESGAEALYQIATGAGYRLNDNTVIQPYDGKAARGGGDLGGVGFRERALHVVLHITDAPSHWPNEYEYDFPDTRSLQDAIDALNEIDARVVSVVSGICEGVVEGDCDDRFPQEARGQLEWVAFETGAVTESDDTQRDCPFGVDGIVRPVYEGICPLVFDVTDQGKGLAETFTTAITTLVNDIRFQRVTAVVANDPLAFIESVRPVATSDESPKIDDLLPSGAPDGEPDTFLDARAGAPIVFEVTLRNVRLAPRDEPQLFRVVLQILGDDLIVEERTLRIVVPAGELPARLEEDAGR